MSKKRWKAKTLSEPPVPIEVYTDIKGSQIIIYEDGEITVRLYA